MVANRITAVAPPKIEHTKQVERQPMPVAMSMETEARPPPMYIPEANCPLAVGRISGGKRSAIIEYEAGLENACKRPGASMRE